MRGAAGSRPASQRSSEVLPTPERPSRQVVRPAGNSEREVAGNQAIAEGDARITHEKGRSSRQVRHQSLRRY